MLKAKLVALLFVLLSACNPQANNSTQESDSNQVNLDNWIGRWNGPEGTYLTIAKAGTGYTLEIADLDGPSSYSAIVAGEHLEFVRNGQNESIRASDGETTGMKWLLDKKDCLTIKAGEGFCRD